VLFQVCGSFKRTAAEFLEGETLFYSLGGDDVGIRLCNAREDVHVSPARVTGLIPRSMGRLRRRSCP
jgi:hypothetical protein